MRCSYLGPRQVNKQVQNSGCLPEVNFRDISFNMHSIGFETSRHTHTIGATVHEQSNVVIF